MCGPDQAQVDLEQNQAQFYAQLRQQDQTLFGEDQGILQQLQSVYAPILAAGPNQYGHSDAEDTLLNSQATEGVARNYRAASTALKEEQAAEGGGNSYLPSGAHESAEAQLNAAAAGTLSDERMQIKQAGFDQGYKQFSQATTALEGASSLMNPAGTAAVANQAGSDENATSSAIAQENSSWMAPLAGAVGAIGGAATAKFLH
jgi:hypothetical protein